MTTPVLPQSPCISFAIPRIGALADEWRDMLGHGVRTVHTRNSIVMAEGATSFDLFYIESGEVHVLFDTLDGRVRSVVSFEAGSMFNLAQAAARSEASGQYQCVTDAVIWRIPGAILHDLDFAAAHPALMISVIHQLGRIVLTHHTFLTDMLMDDFVIRFSRFLLSLSQEHDALDFAPGLTQERLSAMLGIHRATLARAIRSLKDEGVIDGFTHRRVHILDLARLRARAAM